MGEKHPQRPSENLPEKGPSTKPLEGPNKDSSNARDRAREAAQKD